MFVLFLKNKKGFSLIELIMYVGVIVFIGSIIVSFVPNVIRTSSYLNARGEVLNSTRVALDTIAQEIKHSYSVYPNTSVFDSSSGQLSLEKRQGDIPSGETSTFVDFYIDDGRLYIKREDSPAQLIFSEKIFIDDLEFNYLNSSDSYPAVRVSITAHYDTSSTELQDRSSITLASTASLRSY
jgi:type II secretory pathway pseudopilin PulG